MCMELSKILADKLALRAAPLQRGGRGDRRVPLLSVVVRSFKADVARRAGLELGCHEEIWQRNYFDRVIRDDREFLNAALYIAENPVRWEGKRLQKEENGKNKTEAGAASSATTKRSE
jgi:hypothetical protein